MPATTQKWEKDAHGRPKWRAAFLSLQVRLVPSSRLTPKAQAQAEAQAAQLCTTVAP